jgi:hypothetical protein
MGCGTSSVITGKSVISSAPFPHSAFQNLAVKPESSAPINPIVESDIRNIVEKRDHPRRTKQRK